MAVNAETGIDPVVDRFVIWRVSTNQITNFNATWPRLDGGPIVGGNTDYQYFRKVAGDPPSVDHRFTLATTFATVPTSPTPPEGYPAGTYEASYEITKLSIEDLKIQVETEFQRQVSLLIPATSVPSELAATLDAVVRKQDGAVLTGKQQGKREQAKTIGDKLTQLEVRRDALFASIDANEDYDITAGWVIV